MMAHHDVLRAFAVGCGAIAALVLLPSAVGGRALPPATTAALQQAFASVPHCRIDAIEVLAGSAVVRLCATQEVPACFSLRLDDPQHGCDGDVAGPWCVHWITDPPPQAMRAAVRDALRDSPSSWITLEAPRSIEPGTRPAIARFAPWTLALALVIAPLLMGIVIGRILRRRRSSRRALAAALAADAAVAIGIIAAIPHVGAWDIVSVATLLAFGLLLGAADLDGPAALALVTSSAVALAALEWSVRRWLPPPPQFPAPTEASFVLTPGTWDIGCGPLFDPADIDDEVARLRSPSVTRPDKRGAMVVHLGDSMTFGQGVPADAAFPALLDRRHADVVHANYGVPGVGTDYEYLLLQRILAIHRPAMVVLHVFLGNDVFDIDRPYECCEMGPLLAYPPSGPRPRCAAARFGFTIAGYLGRSPPPYPLRVATAWSSAARHAAAAFSQLAFHLDSPPHFISSETTQASREGWAHFAQILAAIRDQLAGRGIELVVDLIPNRTAVELAARHGPSDNTRQRVAAITAQLAIRTVDPWNLFVDAVQRDGARRYFLDERDIHLTADGHRLLAEWLDGQLPPVTAPSRPETS